LRVPNAFSFQGSIFVGVSQLPHPANQRGKHAPYWRLGSGRSLRCNNL
jgi:hypothetical protein